MYFLKGIDKNQHYHIQSIQPVFTHAHLQIHRLFKIYNNYQNLQTRGVPIHLNKLSGGA